MSNEDGSFGATVRRLREEQKIGLRKFALMVGMSPTYLSKVERDEEAPPSEEKIVRLAAELGEDPDVLLAIAGKVSSDLRQAILKRPELFGTLIRELKDMPDRAVLRLVREVRDGKW